MALGALTALTGCLDLKEDVITGVTTEYYTTPAGADAAITAAYARLRDYYGQEMEVTMGQLGTDTWTKGSEGGYKYFNDYTSQLAPSGVDVIRNFWQYSYSAINNTNTAIKFIEDATGLDPTQRSTRIAEARFLRALYYLNLVRTYGAVYLTLEPSQGVVTTASRTPVAEIFSQAIIPDLEYAVSALPATQPEYGRATKGAAQALLAEAYLTRGAAGDMDQAFRHATDLINSGTYSLLPTYRDLFCGPVRKEVACDLPANEQNAEVIWAVQFTGDGVNDQWGNSLHLYYIPEYDTRINGLIRSVEYGRPYRRARPSMFTIGLWDRAIDTRYHDTFQNVWYFNTGGAVGDTAIYMPGTATVLPEHENRPYLVFSEGHYAGNTFPGLKKWQDPQRVSIASTVGSRDRPIFRLGEVYLLAAEAKIRAGQVADAIPFINAVRRRAALPGQEAAMEVTSAEVEARGAVDFLLDERARELFGEEIRWWVLNRMGKLVERVQLYNPEAANIKAHHVLRPIPQEQIDRTDGNKEAFPQNDGY
jgi:hypothetical protein